MKCKLCAPILALLMLAAPSAQATLIDRGSGLIYDDVLDITWLQDAGLGGDRTWDDAVAWADGLVFGGFDNWRLPLISVAAGVGGSTDTPVNCNGASELACRDNELGYMYYHNLGGTFGDNLTGNQGLIENIQVLHWSGTELASNPGLAWGFFLGFGVQGVGDLVSTIAAWAVRPGDVLTVPEPPMGLLLAAGLVGLGVGRRRTRARLG